MKLFFVGADKSGVVVEAALPRRFHYRGALEDQGTGKKEPFTGNIIMEGIPCFFFKFPHHMVFADVIFLCQSLDGQILFQVTVNILKKIFNTAVSGVGFLVENIGFIQENPVEIHHKFCEKRVGKKL